MYDIERIKITLRYMIIERIKITQIDAMIPKRI